VDEPAATGDGLASFGRWLVRERELRGLAPEEVTRATRLAPAVVEALESGERGRIPPRAYVVGYLRSYALAVGLDPEEVVLRFHEAAGPGAAGPGAAGPGAVRPGAAGPEGAGPGGAAAAKGRRRGLAPSAILAVALAIGAAGAALWALLGS
jgi:cytoskeletal protein RodZ